MPNRIIKEAIRTSKDVNNLNDFQFRVWTYLITYVDDYGRGSADPELLKGLVFPRRKGITEKQIGEALSVLASSGMINLYQVDGEPYFYFPTWEKHQTVRATKSKFPAPPTTQASELVQADASNCKQTQANVPVIQSYSYSESKNENDNPPKPPKGGKRTRASDALFDKFWSEYPRKVGKGDAHKAWDKLKLTVDSALPDIIFAALEQQKGWDQWQREGGRYIPHPATWLNQQRWEDEGIVVEPVQQPVSEDMAAWLRGDID